MEWTVVEGPESPHSGPSLTLKLRLTPGYTGWNVTGMVAMNRVRVAWTGFTGGPGVSTFYFGSTTTNMQALVSFFTAISNYLPNNVTVTVPALGDQINDTDGLITGAWTGTNGGSATGFGGSTAYAGSAGICVDWLSSSIIAGRRRQGRTFLVPASTNAYQNDGTISESVRSSIVGSGVIMIAAYAGEMKVWSRPFPGKAAEVGPPPKPAKPARVGAAVQVIACRVPDIAAVLRSRRQ